MDISAKLVKELREKTGAGLMDCKKALVETNGDIEQAVDWLREKGIAKAAKKASRIAAEGACEVKVNENAAVIFELNCETDFVAKNDKFQDLVSRIGEALLEAQPVDNDQALETKVNGKVLKDMLLEEVSTIGENLTFRRYELVLKNDDQTFGAYVHMGGKIASLAVLNGVNQEVAKDIAMHAAAMRPLYVNKESVDSETIEKERHIIKEQAINEGKPAEIAEKMVEGRIRKFYEEVCLEEQAFIKDGDIKVATYASNNNCKVITMLRYEVGEGMEKREENFAEEVQKQING